MARKIAWQYYMISAVITIGIFVFGIWAGLFLNKEKILYFENSINEMLLSQMDTELEFFMMDYFGNKSCDIIQHELEKIMINAEKLGKELEYYEESERLKDEKYYYLKKKYTLILTKYWIYWKKLKEMCGYDVNLILYFYSNDDCFDCEKQASVLAYVKQKDPAKNMIFAIDYNLDLNTVKLLESVYEVNQTPTLIINDNTYRGFQSIDDLENILFS